LEAGDRPDLQMSADGGSFDVTGTDFPLNCT
jgi:hypothetical protein